MRVQQARAGRRDGKVGAQRDANYLFWKENMTRYEAGKRAGWCGFYVTFGRGLSFFAGAVKPTHRRVVWASSVGASHLFFRGKTEAFRQQLWG
jgi:hypothetical protein